MAPLLKLGLYPHGECFKKKLRLQRETLNPLGAFILDPSGKSIS
jgi:hypothetical protein